MKIKNEKNTPNKGLLRYLKWNMRKHNPFKYLLYRDLCIKYEINERLIDLPIIFRSGIKR